MLSMQLIPIYKNQNEHFTQFFSIKHLKVSVENKSVKIGAHFV